MKKITFFSIVLAALLGISVNASASADSPLLFDVHKEQSMTCVDCHEVAKPVKPASWQGCLACHGEDYETLAATTAKMDPNPHYTHLGDMPCTECHNNHKPSVNVCGTCHNIDMKVP